MKKCKRCKSEIPDATICRKCWDENSESLRALAIPTTDAANIVSFDISSVSDSTNSGSDSSSSDSSSSFDSGGGGDFGGGGASGDW